MRFPRLPALLATGTVLLTSLQPARALAAEPPSAVPAPYVIAIDAGHGGSVTSDPNVPWDPGVVAGTVMEKDLTLDLALRLRTLLTQERVRVVMTRTADRFMSIADRWAVVNASGARMFVSLHVNGFDGDSSVGGAMVLYDKPGSVPLARSVEAGLSASLAPFQIQDDGIVAKPELWVHSGVPTVTVEPAYLSNPREATLLQRPDFRQAIVQGIYQGVLKADPRIETTRQAIVRAQALAAQRVQAVQPRSTTPASGFTSWWLLAGTILVVVLLVRGRSTSRVAFSGPRRRAYRRPLRRRRTLHRSRLS